MAGHRRVGVIGSQLAMAAQLLLLGGNKMHETRVPETQEDMTDGRQEVLDKMQEVTMTRLNRAQRRAQDAERKGKTKTGRGNGNTPYSTRR